MTNYNKRLDEVLETVIAEAFIYGNFALGKGVYIKLPDDNHELPPKEKAKQAITSLIKELVAEAKPEAFKFDDGQNDATHFYNKAVSEYEQNLLKELEEV